MPMEPISMKKLRETLRLKFESNLSHRTIGKALSISPGTVSYYVRALRDTGLSYDSITSLSDPELVNKLLPYCRQRQVKPDKWCYPEPNYTEVHKALKRKGVNLQLLWEEYKEHHGDNKCYSYSQFCRLYRLFKASLEPEYRHHYQAGEYCFIDYCGPKIPIYHPDGTVAFEAYVFVATLGASQYTYAEAVRTRGLEDWVGSHTRLFSFLGGVPSVLVPDNEKSAVKDACYYEPDINPTYSDLAAYYDTAVVPARPGRPKDKALVEKAVQCIETWVMAKLRHHKFESIAQLNVAMKPLLQAFNEKPMQKLNVSRSELFNQMEKTELKPLPSDVYILARFTTQKVNLNYHVNVEGHYYSVPHAHIKKRVICRLKPNTIDIFYQNQCIASHLRQFTPGNYSTIAEHMPNIHRYKQSWTPQTYLAWAKKLQGSILEQVQAVIAKETHPERLYRIHNGMKQLLKGYSQERFEHACAYANQHKLVGYRSLKSILKHKLDQTLDKLSANDELPLTEKPFIPINGHSNVRGGDYFL